MPYKLIGELQPAHLFGIHKGSEADFTDGPDDVIDGIALTVQFDVIGPFARGNFQAIASTGYSIQATYKCEGHGSRGSWVQKMQHQRSAVLSAVSSVLDALERNGLIVSRVGFTASVDRE